MIPLYRRQAETPGSVLCETPCESTGETESPDKQAMQKKGAGARRNAEGAARAGRVIVRLHFCQFHYLKFVSQSEFPALPFL